MKLIHREPTSEMLRACEEEQREGLATLNAELAEADASLKAVEKALDGVDYRGTYADGVLYLKAQHDAVKQDALRYRFMRDEWSREDDENSWYMDTDTVFFETREDMDKSIDSASLVDQRVELKEKP